MLYNCMHDFLVKLQTVAVTFIIKLIHDLLFIRLPEVIVRFICLLVLSVYHQMHRDDVMAIAVIHVIFITFHTCQ